MVAAIPPVRRCQRSLTPNQIAGKICGNTCNTQGFYESLTTPKPIVIKLVPYFVISLYPSPMSVQGANIDSDENMDRTSSHHRLSFMLTSLLTGTAEFQVWPLGKTYATHPIYHLLHWPSAYSQDLLDLDLNYGYRGEEHNLTSEPTVFHRLTLPETIPGSESFPYLDSPRCSWKPFSFFWIFTNYFLGCSPAHICQGTGVDATHQQFLSPTIRAHK